MSFAEGGAELLGAEFGEYNRWNSAEFGLP